VPFKHTSTECHNISLRPQVVPFKHTSTVPNAANAVAAAAAADAAAVSSLWGDEGMVRSNYADALLCSTAASTARRMRQARFQHETNRSWVTVFLQPRSDSSTMASHSSSFSK